MCTLFNFFASELKSSFSSNIYINPNTIKSYKNYLQNTQHMVLRNRPTLIIGTERLACLNSPTWHAAGDPRLAHGRSRVRAPGPAGALRVLFFSTLPSFLLPEISFFRTFPTNPAKVLGLMISPLINAPPLFRKCQHPRAFIREYMVLKLWIFSAMFWIWPEK